MSVACRKFCQKKRIKKIACEKVSHVLNVNFNTSKIDNRIDFKEIFFILYHQPELAAFYRG